MKSVRLKAKVLTLRVENKLGYKNIFGVDTSKKMIKRGNKEYPHLSLKQNSKVKLEYPDEHFDFIIICAVLTCVPSIELKTEILSEIHRLLKNGGIFHMVEFCSESGKTFTSSFGIKMEHQRSNNLYDLATSITKELKFEVIKTQTLSGKSSVAVNYFGSK